MWDMFDNLFSAVGRGAKVADLSMEKVEITATVEVAALKQVYTESETLEGVLKKTRKEVMKNSGSNTDEFNPFANLKIKGVNDGN